MNKSVLKLTTCASLFLLLTACGGSDDSSTSSKKPTITESNLEEISTSTFKPLQTLPYVIESPLESSIEVFSSLSNIRNENDVITGDCNISGKVDVIVNIKDLESGSIANNDSISMTFDNCSDAIHGKLNGSLDIVFTNVGDSKSGLDGLDANSFPSINLNFDKFEIEDSFGLSTAHGELKISAMSDAGSNTASIESTLFSVGDNDGVTTIKDLDMAITTIGADSSISLNASGVMNTKQSNISYSVNTISPIDSEFTKGSIIFKSSPSTLTITYDSDKNANVALDSDGDGVVDYTGTL